MIVLELILFFVLSLFIAVGLAFFTLAFLAEVKIVNDPSPDDPNYPVMIFGLLLAGLGAFATYLLVDVIKDNVTISEGLNWVGINALVGSSVFSFAIFYHEQRVQDKFFLVANVVFIAEILLSMYVQVIYYTYL